METLHIQINTSEAINSRRKLLSAEINLLNMKQKLGNYAKLRKLELKAKVTLRSGLRKVLAEMREIKKQLPKTKRIKEIKISPTIGKATKTQLERELNEIREELKKLS